MREIFRRISDNHMDMCRFYGLSDPEYEKVASCLLEILKEPLSSHSCQASLRLHDTTQKRLNTF